MDFDRMKRFIELVGKYKRIPIHIESFNKLSKGGARPGSYDQLPPPQESVF